METKIVLSFVSTCIEATARTLGVPYTEVFNRMQRLGMIEKYSMWLTSLCERMQ